MIPVLVFPCGSEIGLEIYRSLATARHFHLVGGSSVADHGRFVYSDYVGGLPYVTDSNFIPAIRKLVQEKQIQLIFPATDKTLWVLKSAEHLLGCRVVAGPAETTSLCYSKLATYQKLEGSVAVPILFKEPPSASTYPVFVKPDIGHSSIGARKIKDAVELQAHENFVASCIVQEYLPGEEFTIDCFTDRHGRLRFAQARTRSRIQNGISVNTRPVAGQQEFVAMAEAINSKVLFRGAWFFQVKRRASGEPVLMEMASRIGGSSGIWRAQGINLTLLSAFDALDMDVELHPQALAVELDRALENRYCISLVYDKVYCDFDDCLLMGGHVNTQLVAFLYSCINKGKRIVLLSRYKGDLSEKLRQLRLNTLFDEVWHLTNGEAKADFINSAVSIFIDDSYAERWAVQQAHGIPVFSPDAIEALL